MNEKETIPIVFSADDNYMLPLITALVSLLAHKKDSTVYHIYIVCSNRLSGKNQKRLLDGKWSKNGDILETVRISDDFFQGIFIHTYISVSAYYRLLIPELLQGVDRCIYLDCDLLVMDDLTEFYHTDLEGYYLAGIPDCGIRVNEKGYRHYAEKICLPSIHNYINSGVLLMNLSAIRRDRLQKEMYQLSLNSYPMADQDVLNIACYGKIKILPLKYNLFKTFWEDTILLEQAGFQKEECTEAEERPVILHFAEELKPWNNYKIKAADIWYQYAGRALTEREYEEMLKEAERLTRLRDNYYLPEHLEEKNIVVYGYTFYGREVLSFLKKKGADRIVGFCDNDILKQGATFEEYQVYSLQELLKNRKDLYFVIAGQKSCEEIDRQLRTAGVPASNISRYIKDNKDTPYYMALNPDYYEEELNGIMEQEMGEEGWTCHVEDIKSELKQEKYKDIAHAYRMKHWILRER